MQISFRLVPRSVGFIEGTAVCDFAPAAQIVMELPMMAR